MDKTCNTCDYCDTRAYVSGTKRICRLCGNDYGSMIIPTDDFVCSEWKNYKVTLDDYQRKTDELRNETAECIKKAFKELDRELDEAAFYFNRKRRGY